MTRTTPPILAPIALALVSLAALVAHVHAADTSPGRPRGVAISQAERYHPYAAGKFTCLDGSAIIPFAAVNDDYCDCADGSDEPGTSACPQGRFHCTNAGHNPAYIPSGRVNDGVCEPECCDGSDEYGGIIVCPNTCKAAGAAWRKEQRAAQRARVQGLRKKEEYRKSAAAAEASRAASLTTIATQIADLEGDLSTARAARDQAEADERNASERDALLGKFAVDRLAEQVGRLQTALTAIRDVTTSFRDSERDADTINDWLTAFDGEMAKLFADDLEVLGEIPAPAAADNEFEAGAVGKLKKWVFQYVRPKVTTPLDAAKKSAETARSAVWDLESKQRDLETERGKHESAAKLDTAGEPAYFALADKCFTVDSGEYTYELCPFNKAEQRSIGSSYGTSLGSWGRWEDDGKTWVLDNGQACWNGPNRSLKVTLECGEIEILKGVSEPSKCEYHATFVTAAACTGSLPDQSSSAKDMADRVEL
ncbi:glucosidase II beta subunit-like-domain-containing protein [Blastocladiella britannica]|nr:glucosidase II beta subunit-like-domain-containing protein [Blastocladiella britannica]